MKKIISIGLSFIMCLSLAGCIVPSGSESEGSSEDESTAPISNVPSSEDESSESGNKTVALGESFEYSGFTITLGSEAKWTTIDNAYNELNGSTVFAIPCNIVNNNTESTYLSYYDFTQFGPDGTELESSYAVYDFDDSIDNSGNLRTGASFDGFIYFLYTTDGDYVLEFTDYTEDYLNKIVTEITIPIAKP